MFGWEGRNQKERKTDNIFSFVLVRGKVERKERD